MESINKISQEDLIKIQSLNQVYHQEIFDLGLIAKEMYDLKNKLEKLEKQYNDCLKDIQLFSEKEKELAEHLTSKYGECIIDPQTGEIKPNS
jgi:hypothetical protein